MAKYRQLYTDFWSDDFILELNLQEKLFYLYLLTNTKSTQAGIYQISPKLISLETGCDKVLVTQLLKKFCDYKKILYCEETNEIMILNWMKYNVPNNKNFLLCVRKEIVKIKNKKFLELLYEKYEVAGLDVANIFKGIFVNVVPPDVSALSLMEQDYSDVQSNNIIIKPINSPLVGATHPLPSNRVRSKEEGVKSKEQKIINKEEAEALVLEEKVIIKKQNPAATIGGIDTIIKIFQENVHAITPLVYEKILSFTKQVSDEVIIMAIKESVSYNAKNIKYISQVINSWISKGIRTAEQVIAYQKKWTSNNIGSSNSGSRDLKSGSFCDYEQRTYDFDLLEKQLLGIA